MESDMPNLMDESVSELITTVYSNTVEIVPSIERESSTSTIIQSPVLEQLGCRSTQGSSHNATTDHKRHVESSLIHDPDTWSHCSRCRGIHQHRRIAPPLGGARSEKTQIGEVIPRPSISNICTAMAALHGRESLTKHFTHVLSFHDGILVRKVQMHTPPVGSEIISKQIHLIDDPNENIIEHFPEICAFIHHALLNGGNVLVHCRAGVSRSATAVMAFLMWSKHLSMVEAWNAVKKVRSIIEPNVGFQRQLKLWGRLGCSLIGRYTRKPKLCYSGAALCWPPMTGPLQYWMVRPNVHALDQIERPKPGQGHDADLIDLSEDDNS